MWVYWHTISEKHVKSYSNTVYSLVLYLLFGFKFITALRLFFSLAALRPPQFYCSLKIVAGS
jgi:hypothetical protein